MSKLFNGLSTFFYFHKLKEDNIRKILIFRIKCKSRSDNQYLFHRYFFISFLCKYEYHIIHACLCLRMYVCWWILKLGDYVLRHFTKSFVCYFCEDDRYGLVIAFSSHIILYTFFKFLHKASFYFYPFYGQKLKL